MELAGHLFPVAALFLLPSFHNPHHTDQFPRGRNLLNKPFRWFLHMLKFEKDWLREKRLSLKLLILTPCMVPSTEKVLNTYEIKKYIQSTRKWLHIKSHLFLPQTFIEYKLYLGIVLGSTMGEKIYELKSLSSRSSKYSAGVSKLVHAHPGGAQSELIVSTGNWYN